MINNIPYDIIGILPLRIRKLIKAGYIIVKIRFKLFENKIGIFEEIGYNISE